MLTAGRARDGLINRHSQESVPTPSNGLYIPKTRAQAARLKKLIRRDRLIDVSVTIVNDDEPSRQEPPAAGVPIHARDRLHNHAVFRTFGIEDAPSDDDVLRALLGRGSPKHIDGVETGFRQRPADIGIEAAEGFGQLPVG